TTDIGDSMRAATLLLLFVCGGCHLDLTGWCWNEDGCPSSAGSGGRGGGGVPRLAFSVQPNGAAEGASITPAIQVAILDAAGVGVVNGVLYAVGGTDGSGSMATVEAYDPVTNRWTTKAPMPTPRTELGVGVVNGVLYAVGGDYLGTVEAFDPVTNSWTTKAAM